MPDNDYRLVRMIHADIYRESGGRSGLAEVPETAVPQHFLAGWALVAEDQPPAAQEAGPEPRAVSLAELQSASQPAEQDPGGGTAGDKAAPRGKATGGRGAGQSEE